MPRGPLGNVATYLRRIVASTSGSESTDQALLEAFAERRDEAAFATLMKRHGRLVLGVCRRILPNPEDAEDAYQAVLVLARKAGAVQWQKSVRGWLYQVACRVSMEQRGRIAWRQARDRQLATNAPPPEPADRSWRELSGVLDEEVNSLPEAYRLPILLCCLEGKTRDEAARELGWSPERAGLPRDNRQRALPRWPSTWRVAIVRRIASRFPWAAVRGRYSLMCISGTGQAARLYSPFSGTSKV
jgi:RNA polymerase sigma factor (sigma-70 family)